MKLRPVKVFRTSEMLSPSTPARIPEAGNEEYTRDWMCGDGGVGAIVVNGSGGEGGDIFFALERAHGPGYVFVVDQRKRVAAAKGERAVGELAGAARALAPTALLKGGDNDSVVVGSKTIVFAAIFSSFSEYTGESTTLPADTALVCRSDSRAFHGGTMAGHPAAAPYVNVNVDCESWIRMFLASEQAKTAAAIVDEREQSRFSDFPQLKRFVEDKGGSLRADAEAYFVF